MITLQRRQLVGHDILLARHGNHICSMRVDRSSGRVIALLDDGSVDSAPNLIAPGLRLPETMHSVVRDDWKFVAALSGITVAVGGVLVAASAAFAAAIGGDPEMVEMLTAYANYAY